jgi:1-acyl-sn-glycerol-3-phosphate acyltransferase
MIEPTPEQLAVLSPFERFSFRVADFVSRRARWLTIGWNSTVMSVTLWAGSGQRVRLQGLENIAHLDKDARVLLVCNHRTYFDFYTISSIWFRETCLSRRMLFPVRADFFYERPLGLALNAMMSGMSMFPPIFRSRRKIRFNMYAIARCVAELQVPGTTVGLHPEGTRNKSEDPYDLLPPQPGVGKIALDAEGVRIFPVFILGPTNNLAREFLVNFTAPRAHPIDVLFGPEIELADLRQEEGLSAQREAARRCMAGIKALAERQREIAREREAAREASLVIP